MRNGETIADIVREMYDYDGVVEEFAFRIEEAAKRDRNAQCEDCEIAKSEARLRNEERDRNCYFYRKYEAQGQVMAATASQNVRLREALKIILDTIDGLGFHPILEGDPLAVAVRNGERALGIERKEQKVVQKDSK